MPWTLGIIDRFLEARVRKNDITKQVAEEIRVRARHQFDGKKEGRAISGRLGRVIFQEHDDLFRDLVKNFGQFTTAADLIALGQKGNKRQRGEGRHT